MTKEEREIMRSRIRLIELWGSMVSFLSESEALSERARCLRAMYALLERNQRMRLTPVFLVRTLSSQKNTLIPASSKTPQKREMMLGGITKKGISSLRRNKRQGKRSAKTNSR